MSTRALVHFQENNETFCTVYVHHDGYPSGVGDDLKNILGERRVFDGIRVNMPQNKICAGIGCVAATYIAAAKAGPGGVYVRKPGDRDVGEEYTYSVSVDGSPSSSQGADLIMRVINGQGLSIFWGDLGGFDGESVERNEARLAELHE